MNQENERKREGKYENKYKQQEINKLICKID